MPVLITGATGMVGRALAARLVDEGAQVRAYVRRDDPELRAMGAHVAIGQACDVERIESALTQVHTIVHLAGGIWPDRGVTYDHLNRETTECAAIAARSAGARRFVFLSFIGADPDSQNEFLAAKGRAEEHITATAIEHAIFRCAPILEGLARTFARLTRGPVVNVPGSGDQRVSAIGLGEVVDALVAADARDAEVRGVWDLGGEPRTMDELAARLAPGKRRVHLGLASNAPRVLTDCYARDILAGRASAPTIEQT
jgi:NADH dehydrogenase